MKQIITKDNSITFYNEQYGEAYHSVTGAAEEAFKKFAEPSLEAVKGKKKVNVLDVCFGLGYNSGAIIDKVIENNPECNISITGIEKDREVLSLIPGLFCPLIKSYQLIKNAVNSNYELQNENIKIKLLVCDALECIGDLKEKYDIIMLDPFSPKKNPELWTQEFFRQLRRLIKEDSILTTYSCAGIVRRNLKAAGFNIKDGPCIGRRSPSTIAIPLPP